MKRITPYKTSRYALASLDNGGRFFNLFTNANDGEVSSAELSKVAGVFTDKQKMILYLEMSISELDTDSIKKVHSTLSFDLKATYKKYKPNYMLPSEALLKGKLKTNAIITGIPKYVKSNSEFNGFVMIPIMANNIMIMTMVPIVDQYDVYEIKDDKTSKVFIIAHARGSNKLPSSRIRCAGIIKELKSGKNGKGKPKKYLETLFYSLV